MTKIPVGFRCSTDRFKKSISIEKKLDEMDEKIKNTLKRMSEANPGSQEHKKLTNTLNQLEQSYKRKKAELKEVKSNHPQHFSAELPSRKKKKAKKGKSIQQQLKDSSQTRKLKEWNAIQAQARREREVNQRVLKKSKLAKQKAIADRTYASELRKMDESFKQLVGLELGVKNMQRERVDVFISHASEDKDSIVRELADSLISEGVKVWYDEYSLSIGDSLSASINKGLNECTFGIVILSPNFIKKRWPEIELQSLYAKEVHKGKTILPIWHRITVDEVIEFNLHLADKFAFNSAIHSIQAMTTAIIGELDKKLTQSVAS
ncbi:TIR domain-containing protein [Photobacterium kasasachensis]|uniref:toll/interleukin-1 receptor domain-containing protein n=1 Tax=Photobacterium kasasachensis TaxID=2910240 RepID=UPI003D12E80D